MTASVEKSVISQIMPIKSPAIWNSPWLVADIYGTLKTDAQRQQLEAEVKEVCKVVSGAELTEDIILSEYTLI